MSFVIKDEKWAEVLQKGLDEYMNALQDSINEDANIDTLSGELYCGCTDCFWRETLFYAAPIIMAGQAEGKIELDAS